MKYIFALFIFTLWFSSAHCKSIPEKDSLPVAIEVNPLMVVEPRISKIKNPDEVFAIVTFSFIISPEGKVLELEIENTKYTNFFNKPMLKAMPKWRFNPQKHNGVLSYTKAKLEVLFTTRMEEVKEFKADCKSENRNCFYLSVTGFNS